MKAHEAEEQTARLLKYRQLEGILAEIRAALETVTEPWPNGPCGQGPFTGNTRESRRVKFMHIEFTETRGGAPPASVTISPLHIEASALGVHLANMLREKMTLIRGEMEKI